MSWKPVIFFYTKTTAWVVIPLILGLIANNFIKSQNLFFGIIMAGFGITCFGIYREIKEYKKSLDKDKNGNK
ncbi:MAG: hypothetical protein WCG28_00865 [bacterium]